MTEETKTPSPSDEAEAEGRETARPLARLEARISQAEAQIVALQDRVAELDQAARSAKQRGLWLRVFLLVAALAAFFVIRSLRGG